MRLRNLIIFSIIVLIASLSLTISVYSQTQCCDCFDEWGNPGVYIYGYCYSDYECTYCSDPCQECQNGLCVSKDCGTTTISCNSYCSGNKYCLYSSPTASCDNYCVNGVCYECKPNCGTPSCSCDMDLCGADCEIDSDCEPGYKCDPDTCTCVPDCSDACTKDSLRCSGSILQICRDCDNDGCLEWCDYQDCNNLDGWYPYGNGCGYYDYYCSGAECKYAITKTKTDYYTDYYYYCSGDEVWKARDFVNYYVSGGTCKSTTTRVDETFVEDCNAKDGWYCQDSNTREYRNYYCTGNGVCKYSVTKTQECSYGQVCKNGKCDYPDCGFAVDYSASSCCGPESESGLNQCSGVGVAKCSGPCYYKGTLYSPYVVQCGPPNNCCDDVCASNVLKTNGFDSNGDGYCSDTEYLDVYYCDASHPLNVGKHWSCGGKIYCCENSPKYGYNFRTFEGVENTIELCSDGHDNDCDGLIDCDDPDCNNNGNYDGSEVACEVCAGGTWVGNVYTFKALSGMVVEDPNEPIVYCCGDDSNEYWIAYDSSGNTLGVCCDGTWHKGGNCCSDADCKGYDPNTHTKLVCDCPSGECTLHEKNDYTCKPLRSCSDNSDCASGYCCDYLIGGDGECVEKGPYSENRKYLCDPPVWVVNEDIKENKEPINLFEIILSFFNLFS